ncbi:BTB/POZ and MATH domain-containing 2-like protein [Rhynchospora pubera]|uniref:BTB/POZ and MATH domain-containing 2-like protein n=1 Tax=Rhynchospora pubera TaxID=906938 RepID=A0AAV8FMS5_9POAL|nr:BTB/POZ and MATH domain-containing 2-like protein [Rhynchospora pubera]
MATRNKTASNSNSVAETKEGSHDFKITNYSFQKTSKIRSGTFTIGGYSWAIQLTTDLSMLSLHLVCEQKITCVKVRVIVSILDKRGNPSKYGFKIGPCLFKSDKEFSQKNFVTSTDLEKSECLVNDSFTIRCDLAVLKASYLIETKSCHNIVVPPAELLMHIGNLLESGEASDVTFKVDGGIFQAHKLVLAARSPIFKAELLGSMKEARSGTIVIEDMKAPVFKAMLHFIYWDSLSEIELQGGGDAKQDSVFLTEHLLVAADRYGLDRLRLLCEEKLCNCLDRENVINILILAEQHNCSQLKEVCLQFLARPEVIQDVFTSDGFQDLIKRYPLILKELLIQKRKKVSEC